jgi:hypothetical protein
MELGLDLFLFLAATFTAALLAGLAGFAFGIVAASAWLHILTPVQTATLIVWYGLIVQGYAVWKLRHAIRWRRMGPMVLGSACGIPVGVYALSSTNPRVLHVAIGVVLISYGLYGLLRPTMRPVTAGGAWADAVAGLFNGILGGATGFAGIVATIWTQWRAWPKDQQRAVFQPVGVATFIMTALWLGGRGAVTRDVWWMFAYGLPVLLAGTWAGLQLFGRINEAQFRIVVLVLLIASGSALLWR